MLTSEQFGGIARAVIAAGLGALVAKGYIDAATATSVGGALGVLAVAAWSVWVKRA